MVTYDSDPRYGAPTLPPTCPKCGSHRTEVVGRGEDGRTITLRCNACGERSTILVDRRANDAENVTDEIEAIRTVGRALAQLPDPHTRERVLRWAAQRFQIDIVVPASAPPPSQVMASAAAPYDPTLSTEGLQDFFNDNRRHDGQMTAGVDAMAIEANDSIDVPIAVAVPAPVLETPSAEPRTQLESMVHSFVSDFQRLADDWQTAFASPGSGSR